MYMYIQYVDIHGLLVEDGACSVDGQVGSEAGLTEDSVLSVDGLYAIKLS